MKDHTNPDRRLCDACGAPAVYSDQLGKEDVCDECARWRGAERHGEACAALEAIGFGVAMARRAGVDDDRIRAAVGAILTNPHSEDSYPVGGDQVLGGDSKDDRPWLRTYGPLREGSGA
jgi:hypothetical protein